MFLCRKAQVVIESPIKPGSLVLVILQTMFPLRGKNPNYLSLTIQCFSINRMHLMDIHDYFYFLTLDFVIICVSIIKFRPCWRQWHLYLMSSRRLLNVCETSSEISKLQFIISIISSLWNSTGICLLQGS